MILQITLAATMALAVGDAVMSAVLAWSFGIYASTPSSEMVAPISYLAVTGFVKIGHGLATWTSLVLIIVWMFRARHNAELLCKARHRRARGWIIAGWIVPIVNLWFPKQLIDDIWLASDPSTPPERTTVEGLATSPLVVAWWVCLVVSEALYRIGAASTGGQNFSATLGVASGPVSVLAGILAILVVGRITSFQVQRGSDATEWGTGSAPIAQPAS